MMTVMHLKRCVPLGGLVALICLSACGSDAPVPAEQRTQQTVSTQAGSTEPDWAPGDGYSESLERMDEILEPSEYDPDFFCRPSNLDIIERAMDVSQGPITQLNIVAEHLASGAVDENDPATMLIESWPEEVRLAYGYTANDLGMSDESACITLR